MIESLEDHLAENYKEGETNINLSATYHSKIGPHGAKIVASTITWPIQSLNLNLYLIQNEGMQSIINSGSNWKILVTLILKNNNIGCDGLLNICQCHWKNIKNVLLTKNTIKEKGFEELVKADWPNLEKLDLGSNQIGVDGAAFFQKTNWPNLKYINLNYNLITNEGVRSFSKISCVFLQTLELTHNRLDAKAVFYLSTMELPNLQSLSLSRNEIGKNENTTSQLGCVYITQLKVKGLKSLYLFGNQITLNGMKLIMQSGKLAAECFVGKFIGDSEVIRNHFDFQDIQEYAQKYGVICNQF